MKSDARKGYHDEVFLLEPALTESNGIDLAVAFLKFTIDGIPLSEIHYVSPGEMHDLDIEVRVSRWQGATALILQPVMIEQS